jgi:tetratricopeptide (TPR) repeat protein
MISIAFRTAVAFLVVNSIALAAPSSAELEVLQTEATLQYHAKQFGEASTTLNRILALDAKNIQALELMALIQKQGPDQNATANTYERLLKIAPKEKAPAYHFELGMIRYAQKKNGEAAKHFAQSATAKFNAGTSHFYLGLMFFNIKLWKEARHNFTASLGYNDGATLKPVTRYYLASTYAQLGKTDYSAYNYSEAARIVEEQTQDKSLPPEMVTISTDIRRNSLKEIKGLDRGAKIINLSLLTQHDSNVKTAPDSAADSSATAPTDRASWKSTFGANVGYTTSPTKLVQVSPSYKLSTNYNYNSLTRDYDFFTHIGTIYTMFRPYSRLVLGLKTEGTYNMQNQPEDGTPNGATRYKPYSLTGDIGPAAKFELTPRINLTAETTWRPKRFYNDSLDGDSRRSGHGLYSRLSGDFISGFPWWNPVVYGTYEMDHPVGRTYRMSALGFGVSNTVQFSDKITGTGSFDLVATDYERVDTNPKRDDATMTFRTAGSYLFDAHWSGLLDLSYARNDSSISGQFTYTRFTASGGASYNF